jgi:hypothetical protein
MAVVLKTARIGYPKRLYFGRLIALETRRNRPEFALSDRSRTPPR